MKKIWKTAADRDHGQVFNLHSSVMLKIIMTIVIAMVLTACASKQDQPIEPPFQEKVSECSRIADRSERNRCLYGD